MRNDIRVPEDFETEEINDPSVFVPGALLKELSKDFSPVGFKERFFFTDRMADEYIRWAVDGCKTELLAMRDGRYVFDEFEWAWGR